MARLCPLPAQTFLRLEGITGSSTDTNHVGWMDVQTADITKVKLTGIGSVGPSSPPSNSFDNLCFTKSMDEATPALAFKCASSTPIANGTVDFYDLTSSPARNLRLSLTNIYITSVNQLIDESGSSETFCLSPEKYSWNYTYYRTNSGLPGAYRFSRWDVASNSGMLGTNSPAFVVTGIRKTSGVELSWAATIGKVYRIFAVPALNQPFVPIALFTATSTGNVTYTVTPVAPAMFYTVEEVPAGY